MSDPSHVLQYGNFCLLDGIPHVQMGEILVPLSEFIDIAPGPPANGQVGKLVWPALSLKQKGTTSHPDGFADWRQEDSGPLHGLL